MYLSLLIAVVAVVFNRLLIEQDGIMEFYGRWIDRLPRYLSDPLGRCTYCFGGQIALWFSLVKFIHAGSMWYEYLMIIAYVCLTILFIHIIAFIWDLIEKLWEKLNQN